VIMTSSSQQSLMSSSSSCSDSHPSRSSNCRSSSSTSRARWLTWRACTVRSSSCLMMVLVRASANAYSSYALARARLESVSHWVMASTCRSKPCYHARATTLSETFISLSMVSHSWRHQRSSTRPSSSRRKTHCTWDRAP
jgi:hypothetical protein